INAIGGDVFLLGKTVTNSGSITASGGTVGLAAGEEVLLAAEGNAAGERMFVRAGGAGASGTGVLNDGTIEGAAVELKAHGNMYALAINNKGSVRATGANHSGGKVFLTGVGGSVSNSGTIRASAPGAGNSARILIEAAHAKVDGALNVSGESGGSVRVSATETAEVGGTIAALGSTGTGGDVVVEGVDVRVGATASVDASGLTGGGSVRIGGGFQGKDAAVANAETTVVENGASIHADATVSGDAGRVIVWSDRDTRFDGRVTARALDGTGRGGLIEISGKENLTFDGLADASAVSGRRGTVLFDPGTVHVGDTGTTITIASVNGILDTNTNVTIATESGDIIFDSLTGDFRDVSVQWNTDASLGVFASGDVRFNNHARTAGAGSVSVIAGWDGAEADPEIIANDPEAAWQYYVANGSFGIDDGDGGTGNGSVYINDAANTRAVEVGSRYGTTNIAGNDVIVQGGIGGGGRHAHLGFRDNGQVFFAYNAAFGEDADVDDPMVGMVGVNETTVAGAVGVWAFDSVGIRDGGDGRPEVFIPYADSFNTGQGNNWWWRTLDGTAGGSSGRGDYLPEMGAGSEANPADITVRARGKVEVKAGGGTSSYVSSYAQIGHGGSARDWRNVNLRRRDATYNRVYNNNFGNASRFSASIGRLAPVVGDISVQAGLDASLLPTLAAGIVDVRAQDASVDRGENDYALIGHLGTSQVGETKGDIEVLAGGAIGANGGNGWNTFAQIGHSASGGNTESDPRMGVGDLAVTGQTPDGKLGGGQHKQVRIFNTHADFSSYHDTDLTSTFIPVTATTAAYSGDGALYGGGAEVTGAGDGVVTSLEGHITVDSETGAVTAATSTIPGTSSAARPGQNNYVQIGHGGRGSGIERLSSTGEIRVTGSEVVFTGSAVANSNGSPYAQLGHGGYASRGNHGGNIFVTAETGRIEFQGGIGSVYNADSVGYAQLGHGGYDADGSHYGNITVTAGQDGSTGAGLVFIAGNSDRDYVQLGHGGHGTRSSLTSTPQGFVGDITVSSIGDIIFSGGAALDDGTSNSDHNLSAHLGHGGYDADAANNNTNFFSDPNWGHSGAISVTSSSGDITFMAGGTGTDPDNAGRFHWTQLGHGGYAAGGNHHGDITVEATAGDVTFLGGGSSNDNSTDVYNYSQLGHGGTNDQGNVGLAGESIRVTAGGGVTFSGGSGDKNYALLGNGGYSNHGDHSGDVIVTAGTGGVTVSGGSGANALAQIGNGGHDIEGHVSGATRVTAIGSAAGDGVRITGGEGDYASATVGHGTHFVSSGSLSGEVTVNVTAGGLTVQGGGDGYFAHAMIGHGGRDVNGDRSGEIEVTVASGDIEVLGGGPSRNYTHAQIGHGGYGNAVVGNYVGDVAVAAADGAVTIQGGDIYGSYAQVGHGGMGGGTGLIGDYTGSISVSAWGDIGVLGGSASYTFGRIGHGGRLATGNHGLAGESIQVISESGNLEVVAGSSTDSIAQIGHGDNNDGPGERRGDILVDVAGEISMVRGSNLAWIGHRTTDGTTAISDADVTIRAGSVDFAAGVSGSDLFQISDTFDNMIVDNLAGGHVSLIDTGSGGISSDQNIVHDSSFSLNLLSHSDIFIGAHVIGQEDGNLNLVAGWDPAASDLSSDPETAPYRYYWVRDIDMEADIFNTAGSYGSGGGSVYVGSVGDSGTAANTGVTVGSRTGETNVAGFDVNVWSSPLDTDNAGRKHVQIGYNRNDAGTGTQAISGEIRVGAGNDVSLISNRFAVGAEGYPGWGNSPTTGDGNRGYNAYAQIGHGGREALRTSDMSGDITVTAGRDVTAQGGKTRENYAMIGHGGYDNKQTDATAVIGAAEINVTAGRDVAFTGGRGGTAFAQLGHGGTAHDLASFTENAINVNAGGDINFTGGTGGSSSAGSTSYAQLGHGGSSSDLDGPGTDSYRGDITVNAGGKVALSGGDKSTNYALIGNGGSDTNGGYSGTVSVSAGTGGIVLQGGEGSAAFAQIGSGGYNIEGPIAGETLVAATGTAATDGVRLTGGNGSYSAAVIGHGNYFADDSSASGRVDVAIAGGGLTMNASTDGYFSYAMIGHGGRDVNGSNTGAIDVSVLSGDIAMTGGGTYTGGGSSSRYNHVQIGHGGYGNGIVMAHSGDVTVRAHDGAVTIQGGQNYGSYAQVGHGGFGNGDGITGDFNGSVGVRASGDISLLSGGTSYAFSRIGHGGRLTNGDHGVAGDTIEVISETGNLELFGGSGADTIAHIGNGDYNDASGARRGDILVDVAGEISMVRSPNPVWIGHRTTSGTGSISDADVTVRARSMDTASGDSGGDLFEMSDQVGSMMGDNLYGGHVSVIDTGGGGIWLNSRLLGTSAFDLNLLSESHIYMADDAINRGSGDVNLVAGWDPAAASLNGVSSPPFREYWIRDVDMDAQIFSDTASYANGSGSIWVGANADLSAADIAATVGSRAGQTNAAAHDVRVWGGALTGGNGTGHRKYSQIGYNRQRGGTSSGTPVTGRVRVTAANDVEVEANHYAVGTIGYGGWNQADDPADHTGYASFAQIGHGGERGSVTNMDLSGAVIVEAGNDLAATGGQTRENYAKIGHGGYDNLGSTSARLGGSITVDAGGNIAFAGGQGLYAYAQIGHGGVRHPLADFASSDISVTAGGDIAFAGGPGGPRNNSYAFAKIGHGGSDVEIQTAGAGYTGKIDVEAGGSLSLEAGGGGDSYLYSQIGHGGIRSSGDHSGVICVVANGGITLDAGSATGVHGFAQIGHGGNETKGDLSGDVTVVSRNGAVTLTGGGSTGRYAQVGHGGTDTGGDMSGHLNVIAAGGDLTLAGGSGDSAYAMIGHGETAASSTGTRQGGVHLFSSGALNGTTGAGTDSGVRVFHQTGGGLASGDYLGGDGFQMVANGGVNLPDEALTGVNTMLNGNLGNGPISLAFANDIDLVVGAGNDFAVDTAGGFYLLTGGDITMLSSYQNAGTGGVTLVAGWDGTGFSQTGSVSYAVSDPGPPEVLDFCMPTIADGSAELGVDFNCASYGNNGALLTVGSDTQTSRVSVGSAGGANVFAGAGIRLRASDSDIDAATQLGFYGTGAAIDGSIDVKVKDQSLVMTSGTADGAFTQIGHGGTGADVAGGVNAAINVSFCLPGDLTLSADPGGAGSYSQIGHGGVGLAGMFSGSVTVDGARDVTLTGGGAQAYSQIGHGGSSGSLGIDSSGDPTFPAPRSLSAGGTIGIVNTTGAVSLRGGAGAENAYSQIGHGGVAIAGGGAIGDMVTVEAATGGITLQGGEGSTAYALIGSGGYQIASEIDGNVQVDATGADATDGIELLGGDGLHSYGTPRSGYSGAMIGNGGYLTTSTVGGDTTVTVENGGLLMEGGDGYYGNVTIGHTSLGTGAAMSGLVDVRVADGDITLEAGSVEWFSFAQIGHGGWDRRDHSGGVSVTADTGDIAVRSGDGGIFNHAKVGHGGYGNGSVQVNTGAVSVEATAGGVTLESRSGNNAFTQIGHGGLGKGGYMRGEYHDDVTVTAGMGISLDAGGGTDTFSMIGHGGTNARGIFTGAVDIDAGAGGLLMAGGSGTRAFTQVGHGGYNEAGATGVYDISGANVTVDVGKVEMDGGTGSYSYSMIGNGGAFIAGASTGNDVTVTTTGTTATDGVKMSAGAAESAFVMIGSGTRSTGGTSNPGDMDVSGAVTVTSAGGGISLEGASTRSFALIGNGGFEVDGAFSGDTIVRSNGGTVDDGISLRGGGGTYSSATIGSSNNNAIGSITSNTVVDIAGGGLSLQAGSGTLARAAIGLQSRFFQGDRVGDVTVTVGGGDVTMQASNGTASQTHIGSGGYGAGSGANGLISGDVSLTVSEGALTMTGGDGSYSSYAMIGNGGSSARAGNIDGSVTVDVRNDIAMTAGAGSRTYAMIGNGGTGQTGDHGSAADSIRVVSQTGNLSMTVGGGLDSFAQIGMGGATSPGTMQGDICVTVGGSIGMDASGGSNTGNYVQIGHGGRAVPGDLDGKIVVVARGADGISLLGGPGASGYAQIGHGGTDTNGLMTGHLHVIAETGDLTLAGGSGNSAYAMFGHGDGAKSSLGQRGGGVHLFAEGDITGTGGTGAAGDGNVYIFHQNDNGLQPADYLGGDGYQKVANGSINLPAYTTADESTMINGNIGLGAISIIDNSDTDYTIDGGDTFVTTSDDFHIITGGSITMLSSYQNAGSGGVTLVAGWDGSGTASPGSVTYNNADLCDPVITNPGLTVDFTNCDTFGNDAAGNGPGTLTLGSSTQTAPVMVGSRAGTTSVAAYGLTLYGSDGTTDASTQLGFRPDGSGAVTGAIDVHLKAGGLALNSGAASGAFTQIGHGGTGGVENGDAINADLAISFCEPGDVLLDAGGSNAYAQIGHGGNGWDGDKSGSIRIEGAGDVTLAAGSTNGYAQIGHGGASGSGLSSGTIEVVDAGGTVTLNGGTGTNSYAQIGQGGSRNVGAFDGEVTLSAGGSVLGTGGSGEASYVQIGHGGRNVTSAGASSVGAAAIEVESGEDIVFMGGGGSYAAAKIGHGGNTSLMSSFAENPIEVTAGRNIQLISPQYSVYTSRTYSSTQIGHGGVQSSVDGGASGYSGDISVEAGGKIDVIASRNSRTFNYSLIGHTSYYNTPGTHSGDIAVAAGTVDSLAEYGITIRGGSGSHPGAPGSGSSYYNFASIGHRGHGGSTQLMGDIDVNVVRGGVTLTGGTGSVSSATSPDIRLHPVQIGHGGYNVSGSGIDGSVRVHAQADILLEGENGPFSPVQIGHGGYSADGRIGKVGDVIEVVSREGNLELLTSEAVSGHAVFIGNGSSTSGSGQRLGDILVDVAGEISLARTGTPVWIGHRSNTTTAISDADVTIRAASVDYATGVSGSELFHVGDTFGSMMTDNLAGGHVSLVGTGNSGMWVNSQIRQDSPFSLNLLSHEDIFMAAGAINQGGGDVNLVAGWDPSVSSLSDDPQAAPFRYYWVRDIDMETEIFNTAGSFANDEGSVWVGVNPDLTGADVRVMVGSRTGRTGVAGHDVNVWAAPSAANTNPYMSAQIGYNRVAASTGTAAISGEIRVEALNDVSLVANRYAVGAEGYPGWGNSPGPGLGYQGYNAYAQIGHGARDAVRFSTLSGDITVAAGRDVTGTGGKSRENFVMIGHGGFDNKRSTEPSSVVIGDAEIRVDAGRDLIFQGGSGSVAFAQVGHGGNAIDLQSFAENAIHVDVGGNLAFEAGTGSSVSSSTVSYAMLGHGGNDSDADTPPGEGYRGDVIVQVGGGVSLVGGDRGNNFALIGHGGASADGGHSGTVSVSAGTGGIALQGGEGSVAFAQIGSGGYNVEGPIAGETLVAATGTAATDGISLSGGDGSYSAAVIGHGNYFADDSSASGGVDVAIAGGGLTMNASTDGYFSYAMIGHGGRDVNGSNTGAIDVSVLSGDIAMTGGGAFGSSRYNHVQIGHGGYGNGITVDHGGAISVNAADGEIAIVGGDNYGAYAQVGHGGFGNVAGIAGDLGGSVNVMASGAISVISGSEANTFARLGHGGKSVTGTKDGQIDVVAGGAVMVTGGSATDTGAQIGHGGIDSSGASFGNVSVFSGGGGGVSLLGG
ncbi:MAG: hypothetical protein WD342_20260, partial [Verrucomicrobiales bacterium]